MFAIKGSCKSFAVIENVSEPGGAGQSGIIAEYTWCFSGIQGGFIYGMMTLKIEIRIAIDSAKAE